MRVVSGCRVGRYVAFALAPPANRAHRGAALTALLLLTPCVWAGAQGFETTYTPGDAITVGFITPHDGQRIAHAPFAQPPSFPIRALVRDYDSIAVAKDGVQFTNKVRSSVGSSGTEVTVAWSAVSAQGPESVVPGGVSNGVALGALQLPTLAAGESERTITITCTATDEDAIAERRDQAVAATLTVVVVKRPTIDATVASIKEDDGDVPAPGRPITSGAVATSGVRLRFSLTARAGSWTLHSAAWSGPWSQGSGVTLETPNRIPSTASHEQFGFRVDAVFVLTVTVPFPPYVSVIDREELYVERCAQMLWDRTGHDELIDNSRGHSRAPESPHDPPNWFDARDGHWGEVVEACLDTAPYLEPNDFVVHYAPHFLNIPFLYGYTDYFGDHAPVGVPDHQYDPAYRGRIYLMDRNMVPDDAAPVTEAYAPRAGGIDFFAQVVAHEMKHRARFIDDWGGFSNEQIGGPVQWGGPGEFLPRNPSAGHDHDGDACSTAYEEARTGHPYHLNAANPYALVRWWTGNPQHAVYDDDEMLARLWGGWSYVNGTHDLLDWSLGGRLDF